MNFNKPPIFTGAQKNEDGSIDKSRAAIIPDPEGKIAEQFEVQAGKEKREISEGFDWEKSLMARHDELLIKQKRQGLSEHGTLELEKLAKVIEALKA